MAAAAETCDPSINDPNWLSCDAMFQCVKEWAHALPVASVIARIEPPLQATSSASAVKEDGQGIEGLPEELKVPDAVSPSDAATPNKDKDGTNNNNDNNNEDKNYTENDEHDEDDDDDDDDNNSEEDYDDDPLSFASFVFAVDPAVTRSSFQQLPLNGTFIPYPVICSITNPLALQERRYAFFFPG